MEQAQALQDLIHHTRRLVFFGGAGVSTESGIPDFRSTGGLYNQQYRYPPEQILSHTFFEQMPQEFYRFYREKMLVAADAAPNAAHLFLARAEEKGILSGVVTQNIDGLHQAAGSTRVCELHGSIHRNRCGRCGRFYDASYIRSSQGIPLCACGGTVKPDVVLYEEPLNEKTVQEAVGLIAQADTLIIGGTSLAVYPAASLIHYFAGKHLVVINKTPTSADAGACMVISGGIAEVFSRIAL